MYLHCTHIHHVTTYMYMNKWYVHVATQNLSLEAHSRYRMLCKLHFVITGPAHHTPGQALFGSTMKSRRTSLSSAPGTVMFIHWLVGMIFIFYLASFVLLMREVVRPGVLWFLRNLNDQNFHPIHEVSTYYYMYVLDSLCTYNSLTVYTLQCSTTKMYAIQ